jgi:hypothetical protein
MPDPSKSQRASDQSRANNNQRVARERQANLEYEARRDALLGLINEEMPLAAARLMRTEPPYAGGEEFYLGSVLTPGTLSIVVVWFLLYDHHMSYYFGPSESKVLQKRIAGQNDPSNQLSPFTPEDGAGGEVYTLEVILRRLKQLAATS